MKSSLAPISLSQIVILKSESSSSYQLKSNASLHFGLIVQEIVLDLRLSFPNPILQYGSDDSPESMASKPLA